MITFDKKCLKLKVDVNAVLLGAGMKCAEAREEKKANGDQGLSIVFRR